MLTLGYLQNSTTIGNVAGVAPTSSQFIAYVNDACRILLDLGGQNDYGWWGTVQAIDGLAYDNCFVWPSNVATVLGMHDCKGYMPVRNGWFEFTEPRQEHWDYAQGWLHCNNRASTMEFKGTTCLFYSIQASPTQIMVAGGPADTGTQITIYGKDYSGQEVTSVQNGVNQRGVVLTINPTGAQINVTPLEMSSVEAVSKPVTNGTVQMFAYANGTPGVRLALYNPGDVNPAFLYSKLARMDGNANGCNIGRVPRRISALVRLGFTPVANPADIIVLDNPDAIKSMVQSLRARESGDDAAGDKFEKTALRRLVAQVNSRFPIQQFSVKYTPAGMAGSRRVNLGMT